MNVSVWVENWFTVNVKSSQNGKYIESVKSSTLEAYTDRRLSTLGVFFPKS